MYALSLGVLHISEVLPSVACAILSGLNASTVGIIALAAVQVQQMSLTDSSQLTRWFSWPRKPSKTNFLGFLSYWVHVLGCAIVRFGIFL